jgi:hypothetical protein
MKRSSLGLLALLLLCGAIARGQVVIAANLQYNWTVATGTAGQTGSYIVLNNLTAPRPSNYTIDWSVSGTTPATCTFRVEGSSDAVNWYGLDVTSPSTTSCTTANMESIAYRPVLFLRVNVTYTQGDTTTKLVFHYTGGKQ